MAAQLGLIARADNSGLGVQTLEYFRHLAPAKVLVIDVGHLHDDQVHTNKRTDLTRFPGADVFKGWVPDTGTIMRFLHGLDVVLSAETFYTPELPHLARKLGVRTVLVPNFEFLDVHVRADLYAAPSLWHFDELPGPKTHLPVPIATDRFYTCGESVDRRAGQQDRVSLSAGELAVTSVASMPQPVQHAGEPIHFLHVVGRPAVHDRNGTADLLDALEYVESEVTVTIRCQQGGYVTSLRPDLKTKPNVTLRIDPGDVDNYWDLYTGDVMVLPRRFGGLCLPVNEALGAGMPVIMPNISPNEWLPDEWLVPAGWKTSFRAKQAVDVYGVNPKHLAQKIDEFADLEFYCKAHTRAAELRDERSWETLKPEYEKVLGNV